MAVAVGSEAVPGSTGNFDITGLSFAPVAFVFFNQFDHLAPHSFTMGCATGSTEQWSVWTGSATETSGYTARRHEGRTDACAFHRNSVTDAIQWQVSLVSLNSDGCTLSLDVRNTVASGEGANIYWMALGGDHITEAHAGTFTAGASTGTVAVTAPGFRPTCAIFAHTVEAFDGGTSAGLSIGVGVTDGAAQYASYVLGGTGSAVIVAHIHRTDAIACYYDGTQDFVMEWESWDANGFTVDVTNAVAGLEHGYLAINAEGAVAGSSVQPDADGDQTYATPGLVPGGVFFCWPGVDAPSTTGSTTAPLRPGVGAATLAEERHSSGIFRSSAPAGVFTSDGYQIATEALGFWGVGDGIAGNSNTSQASTTVASFNEDSYTLTWDVTAPDADRAFGWLALPGELSFIPQIYRIIRVPSVA